MAGANVYAWGWAETAAIMSLWDAWESRFPGMDLYPHAALDLAEFGQPYL